MRSLFQPVKKMIRKAQNLDREKIFAYIIHDKSVQAQILDLNTTAQLYNRGIDAAGNFLGEYSPYTVQYKTQIAGQLGRDVRVDHITLKDTGDFYRSFKFIDKQTEFTIEADTVKEDGTDLQVAYGKKILGLSNESLAEIRPEFKERAIELVRAKILGASA